MRFALDQSTLRALRPRGQRRRRRAPILATAKPGVTHQPRPHVESQVEGATWKTIAPHLLDDLLVFLRPSRANRLRVAVEKIRRIVIPEQLKSARRPE